jgi:hypothetical protein
MSAFSSKPRARQIALAASSDGIAFSGEVKTAIWW